MIVFHVDVMLAKRKMSLTELSERVGITMANLSILKTCLLYKSPSPRDVEESRMPSSA